MEANIHFASTRGRGTPSRNRRIRQARWPFTNALRSTKTYDLNPIDVGETHFREKLITSLETRLMKLQSELRRAGSARPLDSFRLHGACRLLTTPAGPLRDVWSVNRQVGPKWGSGRSFPSEDPVTSIRGENHP